MVARSPPKPRKKIVAPLDPIQLRDTLDKVEKCMDRLQELQYITGGTKVISGVNLSPRSSRGYLRTSLRCKQESLRIRNANGQISSPGRLPTQIGEWKRMSLPAMILGETVGEILQASQFAREIVTAVETKAKKITTGTGGDPKTPVTHSRRNSRLNPETTELRSRRKREKRIIRSDLHSPLLERAKSRINFKVSGSPPKKEIETEKGRFPANRVSPKNKPWARKTVIFPNPLFHSTPASQNQQFCRTRSPVITRTRQTTPHKFLIKTPPPPAAVAKFQVKIRSPPLSVSPTRPKTASAKKKAMSPPKNVSTSAKLRRSFSPSRLATRLASPLKIRNPTICVSPTRSGMASVKKKSISPPRTVTGKKKLTSPPRTASVKKSISPPKKVSTAAKLRRSFSPSRLASRLVSPLKSRKSSVQKSVDSSEMMMNMMSGLKQRPLSTTTPMHLSARRI
ncbi:hypothetical protein Lser_V15G46311 [Lactuca serriola]